MKLSTNISYKQKLDFDQILNQYEFSHQDVESRKELLSDTLELTPIESEISAKIYLKLAELHAVELHEYVLSNHYIEKGLVCVSEPQIQLKLLLLKGNNLCHFGLNTSAHEVYQIALNILEEETFLIENKEEEMGNLYLQISKLYKNTDFNDFKEKNLQKALEIFRKCGSLEGEGFCKENLGFFFENEHQYNESLACYFEALAIFEKLSNQENIANCYNHIGACYATMEDFDSSLKYLLRGLELRVKTQNDEAIAYSYEKIGSCFLLQKKYNAAIDSLLKAKEIFEKTENFNELNVIYKNLALGFEKMLDYKEALFYERKHSISKEQLFDFDKSAAIIETQARIEIEQIEQESEMLRKKNAEIEFYVKKIEISNHDLQQFAHVASHDLKEPLRMIKSFLGIAIPRIEPKITNEEKQFLKFAFDGANRMEHLILGILSVAQLNHKIDLIPVDLNELIMDTLNNLQELISERGASLEIHQMPVLKGDYAQLLQLFQNLIGNGLKYNTNTQPLVSVNYEEENEAYLFAVTDNGIGIPEESKNIVFGMFKRLAEQFEGHGLGLSICRKIVERHHGKIWIEDNPTGGSIFKIRLPK